MAADSSLSPKPITLPDIPALAVSATEAALLSSDGEIKNLDHTQIATLLHQKPVMLCHTPSVRARLGGEALFYAYDVLELFAFIHPTRFTVPTISGLTKALFLPEPSDLDDQAMALIDIARRLLEDLQNDPLKAKADPLEIAKVMGMNGSNKGKGGWGWTPYICSALGEEYVPEEPLNVRKALNIWKNLPEWAEDAPEPPPSHHGVSADEVTERLQNLLGTGAERRDEQFEYANVIAKIFDPPSPSSTNVPHPSPSREREDRVKRDQGEGENTTPHLILAEAGTGVGKTLGYLAPASVWAEKNQASVWISTFTKNLQHQIGSELDRLYTEPDVKDKLVSTRKGRENYLCLLNLEDMSNAVPTARHISTAIAAGIMARWTAASKDGDLSGGDFPGWLTGLLGYQNTTGLADRRGECIYSACEHYQKCFVERSIRKAQRARIVVSNHALTMIQSALSNPGDDMPGRYIFDEGHHLFDAADSAFAAHLTARETRDLRRWILGAEGGKRSRSRGLKKRAEDLCSGDIEAEKLLNDICYEAQALTSEGWAARLKDGQPSGPCETFLHDVYAQVFARAEGREGPYSLECETHPVTSDTQLHATKLKSALTKLQKPMTKLIALFRKKLAQDEGHMDSDTRKRLDAVAASMERRAEMSISAWIVMLKDLATGNTPPLTPPQAGGMASTAEMPGGETIDWMQIERIDGKAIDVGFYRHFVDPMRPFGSSISPHVHGMAVTSATLKDGTDDDAENWLAAQERSGAMYLNRMPHMSALSSPFDYAKQTRVFVVNDVNKNDLQQVAGAYRALFQASAGGALGLFTAIQRLTSVHKLIAQDLEEAGFPLYAQHVDEMDAGTLVDIFRDDIHSCLLGTDAIRDGVDVPGESLRLIVFDRVPWPRPTILHKARREAFGKRRYDEMMTRMKLKQAFGRLIRRADDKGVFVMLDGALPSRLHGAFPEEVEVVKYGLAEVVAEIREFLSLKS